MFKLFWPLTQLNSPAVSIPQYKPGKNEDTIDLQIKSLIYMFKRFNIAKIGPFPQITVDGRCEFTYIELEQNDTNENDGKLDTIYNKSRFEEVLILDEHRILIDYIKNKFRSMLILSDFPKEITDIPEISQDVSFKFSILQPNASNDEYIQILLNESNFYVEHNVTDDLKIELITSILYNQREQKRVLDRDDRAIIIERYLKQLAFHVQVDRIYKATLKSKLPTLPALEEHKQRTIPLKQSFIKTQPTENSYVTKPVPLFLTSPNVRYQSPSRRRQASPTRSPDLKASGNKVTIFDDSMDEDNKLITPLSTPQRTLRASPSKMKLKPSESLAPPTNNRSRSTSPQRTLAKKLSHIKLDHKLKDQEKLISPLTVPKRRYSGNSSSASEFSDTGSYTTSLTNFTLENNNINNMLLSEFDKETLYDQSKSAVKLRIERERELLESLYIDHN